MKHPSFLLTDDLPQVLQIERACQPFPWSEALFNSNQGEHYLNLKLEHRPGQLIGFAITHTVLDEATLFNLAVHPDYQRQGYAEALLSHLITLLMAKEIATLWLEVRASNWPAIALYEKLHFNQVTLRKGYYPVKNAQPAKGGKLPQQDREDAWVMALAL